MDSRLLFIVLVLLTYIGGAQSVANIQLDKVYCLHEERIVVPESDSIRRQIVLDSANQLLIGRWQLIDIGMRTYTIQPSPEQLIEMTIDARGHTAVYQRGTRFTSFKLVANSMYSHLRCQLDSTGMNYFRLRPPRLRASRSSEQQKGSVFSHTGLRICEEFLEIYGFTSSGPYYVFKRLTPLQSGGR